MKAVSHAASAAKLAAPSAFTAARPASPQRKFAWGGAPGPWSVGPGPRVAAPVLRQRNNTLAGYYK